MNIDSWHRSTRFTAPSAMRGVALNTVALISNKGLAAVGNAVHPSGVEPACFCLQAFRSTCRSAKPAIKVLERVDPGVARAAWSLQNRKKFRGNHAVLVLPRLPARPIEQLEIRQNGIARHIDAKPSRQKFQPTLIQCFMFSTWGRWPESGSGLQG